MALNEDACPCGGRLIFLLRWGMIARKGNKSVLDFGGVAGIDCVQRSRVLRTADRPRPYKGTRPVGCLVGAHLCVRPWAKAACVQRADT